MKFFLDSPMPRSVSQAMMAFFASATLRPLRKSEFTRTPVCTSVKAACSTSPPAMTSTMGRSNFLANSQSRVSWAGTAMIAPVP